MAEPLNQEQSIDNHFMKRALELAGKGAGRTNPNPLVGAVVVKDGRIIGEGWHEKYGCAHAEVNAINNATESVEGATVYVNLEPCCHFGKTPPCTELLIREKVKRVVIGTLDPNPLVSGKGAGRLRSAGIEVGIGVMEEVCEKTNEVFFHFIRTGRPFVVLKTAMSLDGKIATATGESKWITGEGARQDVHRLRNRYAGILTGVETIIRDDPELTCRLEGGRNPIRMVLDSRLRIPVKSRILGGDGNPVLVACTEAAPPDMAEQLRQLGAELLFCESRDGRVDLSDLIKKLGSRGIDSVLLEGGSAVNDSAFTQGIVDKMILYVAPKIIGGSASKTAVGGTGAGRLDQAFPLRIDSVELIGEDLKIMAYRKEREGVECLRE